ncbi:hypothetical protein KM043_012151 [Ampulex compressa]|nr:hypothetical protein KM043_012151 [Ampulex compressa]
MRSIRSHPFASVPRECPLGFYASSTSLDYPRGGYIGWPTLTERAVARNYWADRREGQECYGGKEGFRRGLKSSGKETSFVTFVLPFQLPPALMDATSAD